MEKKSYCGGYFGCISLSFISYSLKYYHILDISVFQKLRLKYIQRQNQGLPLQSFQTPKIKNKTNQGSASTFHKCPEIIGSYVDKKYRIFNKEPF